MAQGYYEKLYNNLRNQREQAFKNAYEGTTSGKIENLQSQIKNKKDVLKAGGVSVDDNLDKRNAVEKFLNLPEDQNFIFDIFEILGRPQQALFGAIDAAQKGEDVGKGALEGITGNKETSGGQLLRNAGIGDDKNGSATINPKTWGVDDVLGFALDVFADPVDLALIPVTGGTNLVASAAGDASKAAKAVKAADTASDVAKGVTKNVTRKSLSDLALESVGKAVKGGAKVADKNIEKLLETADKTLGVKDRLGNVTKLVYDNPAARKSANLGKKTIEGVNTNVVGKLETYKDIKDTINRAFNNAANVPKKVLEDVRKNNADTVRAATELKPLYDNLDKSITDYALKVARQSGDDSEDIVKAIVNQTDKDIANLKEYLNLDRTVTGRQLLKEAKSGKLKYQDAGLDGIGLLQNIADDINKADRGLKLTVDVTDDGFVKLNKDWEYVNANTKALEKLKKLYDEDFVKNLESLSLDQDKLDNLKITKKGNYSKKDIEELEKLKYKYENDADFRSLYDQTENVFNEANSVVNKYFDTKLPEKDNKGYIRHSFDKEQFDAYKKLGFVSSFGETVTKGNAKILGERKYNMSIREANNLFKENVSKNLEKLNEKQRKSVEKFLENDGVFKEGMLASLGDYMENIPKLAKDSKNIDTVLIKTAFGDYESIKKADRDIKYLKKYIDNNGEVSQTAIKRISKMIDGDLNKENVAKAIDNIKASKNSLLNDSGIKVLTNDDPKVPFGFRQLNRDETDKLIKKMNKIGDELGLDEFKKAAKSFKTNSGKLALNNDLLRLIEVNADKKDFKGFVRMYDKFLNFFKRNKVLSPTFQLNGLLGNSSNMLLAGISPTKQAALFPEALEVLNKGQDLMLKRANGMKLTSKESDILKIWDGFVDAGFGDPKSLTSFNLNDMPESLKGYFTGEKKFNNVKDFLVDGLPYLNNKMNNYIDNLSRLVTFIEGTKNPSFLKKLDVKDAGEAVRKVMFDPTDLTQFEMDVMKRIIPFYTFTKKNLAFQIDNLSKNGSNYHKLLKTYDKALTTATGDNNENVEDWIKNNLYIPIPALGEDGSYKIIRGSLPFGNLIDTASDPLSAITGLVSPAIKLPIELATNKNSFTGADIEKFPGQLSNNIPFMTKKGEHILGSLTGLDVPLKNINRAYQGIQDTMSGESSFSDIIGNITTMEQNINTDKMNKMYDDLDRLETMMDQYKQRGYEFSTINELKKANENTTTSKIMSTLNKFYGLRNNPYSIINKEN